MVTNSRRCRSHRSCVLFFPRASISGLIVLTHMTGVEGNTRTDKRNNMKVVAWSITVSFILCCVLHAQSETNAAMGRLGYPTGKVVTVEGVRKECGKGIGRYLVVSKVNGKPVSQPTTLYVENVVFFDKKLNTDTQGVPDATLIVLRGFEQCGRGPDCPGCQTPGHSYQCDFIVTEVVSPKWLRCFKM
jgi:hypothetical protein